MPAQDDNPAKRPLAREDVEHLIAQAEGDPGSVDLSFQDLAGANLSELDLRNINLIGANLSRANLAGANLSGTGLLGANLSRANLSRANLAGTALLRENRAPGANLPGTNLLGVNLSGANLLGAAFFTDPSTPPPIAASIKTLSNLPSQVWVQKKLTNLAKTYGDDYACEVIQQWRAQQSVGSEVSAKFPPEIEVNPTDAEIPQESNKELSRDSMPAPAQKMLRFRIEQEPLRGFSLMRILTGLTQIHTRAFLISQSRYEDLITCMQTLHHKFTEEAYLNFITWPPHSFTSRTEFEAISTPKAKADISQTNLAEAFRTGVEAMANFSKTLEAEWQELKSVSADLTIKEQKAYADLAAQNRRRVIKAQEAELGKRKIELEFHEQKIALSEQTFNIKLTRFNKATEAAEQMINMLQPNADQVTKAMLIHSVLLYFYKLSEDIGDTKGLVLLPLLPPETQVPEPSKPDSEA